MKKLLCSFVLLAAMAATAHADWILIDIIICEDPPAAIEAAALVIKVSVWDEANPTGMVHKIVNPTLSQPLTYCDTNLPGVINEWNAWIWPGKKRLYGYDGQWWQIRWDDSQAFHTKSNFTNMHLNFDWRIDPDQSASPNESSPLRLFQWQGKW
jgi:hypothetical protein